ncbi:urease subunit beta [Streptacidiphilus sp. P02-A3a]|uniref:urease subunit beta n=1 Tax=Streptacidiphilus sp. P02-A3a TaxID=2704468 RepID=UPI0015F7CEC4|nr:urease subunit beta [Streptacidiphilus sp. P02-A3a]QMU69563.1 urease subunit beta [Streptacidiphilus sp. P02-A3a]
MVGQPAYLYGDDPVELNAGRRTRTLNVANTGDRAIQVGSHYHFFEANSALMFDRDAALGMHLDIPAGTAVRFEPGDDRDVDLCAFGGSGLLVGFSGLLNGGVASHPARVEAVRRAMERGFRGATEEAEDNARSAAAGTPEPGPKDKPTATPKATPKTVAKTVAETAAKPAPKGKGKAKTSSKEQR